MTPPAARDACNATGRSAGPSTGGHGASNARVNRVLATRRVKSCNGTLPKSFASASQACRSSADRKTTDSIHETGNGAGTRIRRSAPSSSSGNRSSRGSEPSASTGPDRPASPISATIGRRCPASRVDDAIASPDTRSMNSGIQPGKQPRVSR